MIVIVDYKTGNVNAIRNMLVRIGCSCAISSDPCQIRKASKLILPGVGSFDYGMTSLAEIGILDILHSKVEHENTPVLGICLGAQLLCRRSEEGSLPGLNWIPADVKRFDSSRMLKALPVPHMGWRETQFHAAPALSTGLEQDARFYYVHSYHIVCDSSKDELCHAEYGYRFVAGVRRCNIVGVQFHPEKSHRFGMQLLKNFAELS